MKILYHHRTLLDGAEGIHITEMIRAFDALGHVVTTVSPGASPTSTSAARAPVMLRRLLPGALFEVAAAIHSCSEWRSGNRALRKLRPRFLYKRHALNDFGMLKAARDTGIPSVLEVNALYSSQSMGQFEPLRFQRLTRATERLALELATVVVVVSSPLKALVADIAPRAREVIVLPNGVDPVRFDPHITGTSIRKRYGLPSDALVVGWCGIMRSWHGLDLMLEAIGRTNWFLFLIGDGPERERVERVSRTLGIENRVRFAGRIPQSDMPQHLAAIDVGLVADDLTRYASPMKLLEYMAMAKPVVAPDLANIRDVVHHGAEGVLFDPGNVTSLVQRLTDLQQANTRAQLGARGRAQVELKRNWIANAQQVLQAVHELEGQVVGRGHPVFRGKTA